MATPVLRVRGNDSVGGDERQSEPASGGERLMPLSARPKLGVEIRGATEAERLLEKGDISREENQAVAIAGQERGQMDGPPVNCRNSPAERSPASLIRSECHYLLIVCNQMRTEDRANTCGITGTLELYRAVYTVGVSAGERGKALLCGALSQHLRTRSAKSKREVGMGVKVSEHSF